MEDEEAMLGDEAAELADGEEVRASWAAATSVRQTSMRLCFVVDMY